MTAMCICPPSEIYLKLRYRVQFQKIIIQAPILAGSEIKCFIHNFLPIKNNFKAKNHRQYMITFKSIVSIIAFPT